MLRGSALGPLSGGLLIVLLWILPPEPGSPLVEYPTDPGFRLTAARESTLGGNSPKG
jgi:hypothetical protein